jgi:serine/threonine protein phosphatase 1
VIDFLMNASLPAGEIVCLRGNHDQSILNFIVDPDHYRVWRPFGAGATLSSYGVAPPRLDEEAQFEKARADFVCKCPVDHITFLAGLPHSYELGGYLFAHAGVRPGVALDRQDPRDFLWIRDEFLLSNKDFGKVVVHGHSPSENPAKLSNRIGVDTGAYATGHLTAAVLSGDSCRFLST